MADTTTTYREYEVTAAGYPVHLFRGGTGEPVLVLHRDTGNPGWREFHQALAERFDVIVPTHPGYDKTVRPEWLRSVRDIAVIYQSLLAELGAQHVTLVGLGLGGWIAAEMATMAPRDVHRLVLVGAAGLKPTDGDILDQALVNYIDYARAGFHDPAAFEQVYGANPSTDQLEVWDINREMTFRIAWKPYLYSQTLPHLLGGVRAPALVVWGSEDRVVPLSSAHRYVEALPQARLEVVPDCGHAVELEQPQALAELVTRFIAS